MLFAAIIVVIVIAAIASTFLGAKNSTNFCASEFGQQQKSACMEAIAINSNNSTACASFQGQQRDGCYSQIAARTINTTLCRSISNYSLMAVCVTGIANYTGSYAKCSQLNEPYADQCLYAVGTAKLNGAACSSIKQDSLSQTCSYYIYYSEAIANRNAAYCKSIGNGTAAQSSALLQEAEISNLSGSLGNIALITDYYGSYLNISIKPEDLCYYTLAYYTKDSTYCSGISNSSLSGICKTSYETSANASNTYLNLSKLCALNSTGSSICSSTPLINALYKKNATMCRELNTTQSAVCLSYIADIYSNSSYCQYISNITLNSACVGSVLYRNSTNATTTV